MLTARDGRTSRRTLALATGIVHPPQEEHAISLALSSLSLACWPGQAAPASAALAVTIHAGVETTNQPHLELALVGLLAGAGLQLGADAAKVRGIIQHRHLQWVEIAQSKKAVQKSRMPSYDADRGGAGGTRQNGRLHSK